MNPPEGIFRRGARNFDSNRFLAQAGAAIGSTLDYRATLSNLTHLAVPDFADLCVIQMFPAEGVPGALELSHVDPAKGRLIAALLEQNKRHFLDVGGIAGMLEAGRSIFIPVVTDSHRLKAAGAAGEGKSEGECELEREIELITAVNVSSFIGVPIVGKGRVHGAISFALHGEGHHFSADDLWLGERLAERLGIAIENARLYSELQSVNRIKDEFLATLSHELRTPLNVIQGHAEILLSGSASEAERRQSIEAIYRNSKAQTQIINDLLDVSAIMSGKITFVAEPMVPAEIVSSAVDSVAFAAKVKELAIEVDTARAPACIFADANRIHQVVCNLLTNAIKFTPVGGSIKIEVKTDGDQAVIVVEDTGKGIDPGFLPYVFDRFRQEDSATTRKFGGLGLGLSIVRQLVELHGGTVMAESEGRQRGSRFSIRLPTRLIECEETAPKSSLSRMGLATSVSSRLEFVRILVVEDNADTQALLKRMLANSGALISAAVTAGEAFDYLEQNEVDIIVSDIGLPEEDGHVFMRKLRKHRAERQLSHIPAIALTAYARDEEKREALQSGYQRHLAKPVDAPLLVATIADLLGIN